MAPSTMRLAAHAAVLLLGLLLLMPVIGVQHGPFLPDEGALVMQVDTLIDRGTWAAPYTLADLDPDGEHVAIAYATHVDGEIVPYPWRSGYVLMNIWPARAFGIWGMTGLGVLATAGAAFVVGLTTRRIEPAAATLAVWACGLATPLLFNAYGLHGHAVGALCASIVCLAVVRDLDPLPKQRWWNAIAVVTAIAVGMSVRRETAFVAIGVAAWSGWTALRRWSPKPLVLGAAAATGSGIGLLVDRALSSGILTSVGDRPIPASTDGVLAYLGDRLLAIYHTMLQPSYDLANSIAVVGLVGLAVSLAGAIAIRRRQDSTLFVIGLAISAVFAIASGVGPGSEIPVVPGLAVASPLLAAGLALVPRPAIGRPEIAALTLIAVICVGLVLATQYLVGGWWEWGSRYLSVAFPPLAAIAAIGWRTLLDRSPRSQARAIAAVAVLLLAASSALAVSSQREGRTNVREIRDTVVAQARDPATLIVTTELAVGRLDTTQLDDDAVHRWAFAGPSDIAGLLDTVDPIAVRRVVVVAQPDRGIEDVVDWTGWNLSGPAPLPQFRYSLEMWVAER